MENQDEKMLQYLITEPGVNLNLKDGDGQTPLYVAVSSGFKGIALLLAENGADIEGEDDGYEGGGDDNMTTAGGHLDDEIDAAFQDLGLDMGDLEALSQGQTEPTSHDNNRAWEDEMAEMDKFLDEAGAGMELRGSTAPLAHDNMEEDAHMQVNRQDVQLVQTQFQEGEAEVTAGSGLDDVDNLLGLFHLFLRIQLIFFFNKKGQIKVEESHHLVASTQYIVNQDAISNCVIDFISLYTKMASGNNCSSSLFLCVL